MLSQAIESAKDAFAARAGSGKPALLHALFLGNEKQNSRKIMGQCFPVIKVQGHMQKFSSFRGKKKKMPKNSLTLLMKAPLQLL